MEPKLRNRKSDRDAFLRVDAATGDLTTVHFDIMELMRRFHLSVRDLRLLDPDLDYPSSILVRERAILCNLEESQCVITADEMLLRTAGKRHARSLTLAVELQRRHLHRDEGDELPFEFRALEVAVEATCCMLDAKVMETETDCYPLLDELTSKLTTRHLQSVKDIKSGLLPLTRRVQKVRDEIEHLMEDAGDMAEMCLTEKKRRVEASSSVLDEQARPGPSHSAPVSPVLPPSASWTHDNLKNLLGSKEEVEMMLEANIRSIDHTLNRLTTMKEYIDDTLEFINFNLDRTRNQLIKFDLLMSSSSFVTSLMGVVLGIFGMNFEDPFFKVRHAFEWTLTITVVCGLVIFCFILLYFMKRMYLLK